MGLTSCSTPLRFTMKLVVFLFACLAFASSSPEQEWANFKLKFGKGYRSLAHEAERKAIFMTSLEKIESHNAKFEVGLTTYKQGINYYSDWTWEAVKGVIPKKLPSWPKRNLKLSLNLPRIGPASWD